MNDEQETEARADYDTAISKAALPKTLAKIKPLKEAEAPEDVAATGSL